MTLTKGPYRAIHVCIHCNVIIDLESRLHSEGVCPHCGFLTVGKTVCETVVVVVRVVSSKKHWWSLFYDQYYLEDVNGKKYLIT